MKEHRPVLRLPAVAGRFYHAQADRLRKEVEQYLVDAGKERAIGILSPHAGLMYSGPVAGAVYSSILFPETFILIGPNHTGFGARVSLMSSGEWEMPMGRFRLDEELGKGILREVPFITEDLQAHLYEHSLEVQLPFIGYFSPSAKILPLTIMGASLDECREMGEGIARAVRESGRDAVIVASSDMSHYLSDTEARRLDSLALEEVLSLDPAGLYAAVEREGISMCGYLAATVMLYASKALGAGTARLVKYATSGDVSGDYGQVVGYAGVIVS